MVTIKTSQENCDMHDSANICAYNDVYVIVHTYKQGSKFLFQLIK